MKRSRFQFEYRDSASGLHRTIGEVLRNSNVFGLTEIYQEYPVNRVNDTYRDSSHHFDWVLPKLKIVIEGHGKQHYTPVAFDGDIEKALERFHDGKRRDQQKKEAAMAADYVFVEIPYHMEKDLNEARLLELIEKGKKDLESFQSIIATEAQIKWLKKVTLERAEQERREEEYNARIKTMERAKRDEYLASEKHRQDLIKQREYRKQQYQKLKESRK